MNSSHKKKQEDQREHEGIDLRQLHELNRDLRNDLFREVHADRNDYTLSKQKLIANALERLEILVGDLERFSLWLAGKVDMKAERDNEKEKCKEQVSQDECFVGFLNNLPGRIDGFALRIYDISRYLDDLLIIRDDKKEISQTNILDSIP